jgi:integrase
MASIYKRGDNYYLDYSNSKFITPTNPQGRKRESLGRISKQEAEAKRKKTEYELAYLPTSQESPQISFSEYVIIYLNDYQMRNPSSWEESRYMLEEDISPMKNETGILIKNLYLNELTSKDVDNFIYFSIQDKQRAASTINRKLGVLSAFLNHARDRNYSIPNFKIKRLPELKAAPPKYYELDELKKIVAAEKKYPHWWLFIANTGIRAGEFRNLKVKDCKDNGIWILSDPENNSPSADGRNKAGDWRVIPMNNMIKEILKDFDTTGEYLIPRFHKDMPKKRFRLLCQKIGVEEGYWGIHCLRRTFCSQLVMAGKPMRAAQILMGHKSIKTTERYAFLSPTYLEGVMDNFSIG